MSHHGDGTYSLFWETTNHYTIVPLRHAFKAHSQVCRARAHTVPRGVPPHSNRRQLRLARIHSVCPQPAHINVSLCPSFSSRPWSSFHTSSLNFLSLPRVIASTHPCPASDRKPRQRIYIQQNTILVVHMFPFLLAMWVCMSLFTTFPLS